MLPRGGGTSQYGPSPRHWSSTAASISTGWSRSMSKHGGPRVEPGVVLDLLNRLLRKDRLFFPVDPSTASRAAAIRVSLQPFRGYLVGASVFPHHQVIGIAA